MRTLIDWTPERQALLERLWLEGKSCTEIGDQLGISRSAAMGRLTRTGFAGKGARPRPINLSLRKSVKVKAVPTTKPVWRAPVLTVVPGPPVSKPPLPMPVLTAATGSEPRPWIERARGQCAWPIGDDGAMSCCKPTGDRAQVYCADHRARAYVKRRLA